MAGVETGLDDFYINLPHIPSTRYFRQLIPLLYLRPNTVYEKKIAVLVCGCFTCLALAAQDYTALSRNEDGFTVVYKSQSIGTGYYAKTESRMA